MFFLVKFCGLPVRTFLQLESCKSHASTADYRFLSGNNLDYRVLSTLARRSLDLGRIGQISCGLASAEEAEFPGAVEREDNCRSETGGETGRTGAEQGGETGWTGAKQVGGSDRTEAKVELQRNERRFCRSRRPAERRSSRFRSPVELQSGRFRNLWSCDSWPDDRRRKEIQLPER